MTEAALLDLSLFFRSLFFRSQSADRWVTLEDQIQHRHEVRLTGTKTTVQVRRLTGVCFETTFDKVQRVPEAFHQLISSRLSLELW